MRWADVTTLHDLRIAAKWLRYTLEFVREALGPRRRRRSSSGSWRSRTTWAGSTTRTSPRGSRARFLVEHAGDLTEAESAAIGRYLVDRERELARLRRTVGPAWRGVSSVGSGARSDGWSPASSAPRPGRATRSRRVSRLTPPPSRRRAGQPVAPRRSGGCRGEHQALADPLVGDAEPLGVIALEDRIDDQGAGRQDPCPLGPEHVPLGGLGAPLDGEHREGDGDPPAGEHAVDRRRRQQLEQVGGRAADGDDLAPGARRGRLATGGFAALRIASISLRVGGSPSSAPW